jgi:hypothetical protein
MPLTALWVAIGAALIGAGLFVVLRLRRGAEFQSVRLAGVGTLTPVTQLVIGLSLLGAGYHVLVHALGVMAHFRAPLHIAVGVAITAALGSIAIDALERRLEERAPPNGANTEDDDHGA